jgi:putative tryptophan/tyrosine transport system substrate-binding protein
MRRREFLSVLGGAAVAPLTVRAEPATRVRRIGVLLGFGENDTVTEPRLTAFHERLRELGWVEGSNVQIIYRWGAGNRDRIRDYAAELVGLAPDVIMAHSPPVVAALQRATRTVPVVFVQVTDPVGSNFVSNLARPDGNITGFETFEFAMSGKWLSLLKELKPDVTRAGILHDPDNPAAAGRLRALQAVGPSLGVQVISATVNDAPGIERAIAELAREPHAGLVVLPDNVNTIHREALVAAANRHRLPSISPFRYFAAAGGTVSYGIDLIEIFRAAASYVDRILKGAKPGELPVQAPTKYELVVNLKAARALGLDVPPTLLARADEVIE